MFPLLAALGLLALAAAPRRASRGLGDAELVVRDANPELPSTDTLYLVRPEDFAFPSQKAAVAQRGEENGSRWVVAPASGWAGAKPFATARQARTVLRAAGFKGPYGHGASSRWVKP